MMTHRMDAETSASRKRYVALRRTPAANTGSDVSQKRLLLNL